MDYPEIVVIGSCITDFVSYAKNFPKIGESLRGYNFSVGFGGKGANQCIASAHLGAKSALIGMAEGLTGCKVDSIGSAKIAGKMLIEKNVPEVVVTLGKNGAAYLSLNGEVFHIEAEEVAAVDSTGAGDAFVGAFAYFLVHMPHLSRVEIVRRACFYATKSVLLPGTQASYLTKKDLPEELFL